MVLILSEPTEVALLGERDSSESSVGVREEQSVALRGLLGTGIDDLAKYRIVQYLRECSRPLDAGSISDSLGLHPVELVAEAMESLAHRGILVRVRQDSPVYTVECRPPLRSVLERLFRRSSPQENELVLRALAASSLAKARSRRREGAEGGRSQ
ncbi:MAG: hypothetical protein Q7R39_09445 [Dehalococcoidia bacterium]|nr:hypothetical protein [Dehalococcoidia bacterium]